jgi:hypothetical protein
MLVRYRYNRRMSAKHSHNAAKKASRPGASRAPGPAYVPATEAPTFWECGVCGYLASDITFADAATICPDCGASGAERRSFPNERLRHLDERIRAYHAEDESEIVVILGATFLETLLEDLLDRIMSARGADISVRSTVLDNVRAIGQRVGEEFEAAAQELGFRDFPKRWRRIREERNAFIHDTPYREVGEELDRATALRTMELMDQAYLLFVEMNNRFVADGWRARAAAPRT